MNKNQYRVWDYKTKVFSKEIYCGQDGLFYTWLSGSLHGKYYKDDRNYNHPEKDVIIYNSDLVLSDDHVFLGIDLEAHYHDKNKKVIGNVFNNTDLIDKYYPEETATTIKKYFGLI